MSMFLCIPIIPVATTASYYIYESALSIRSKRLSVEKLAEALPKALDLFVGLYKHIYPSYFRSPMPTPTPTASPASTPSSKPMRFDYGLDDL